MSQDVQEACHNFTIACPKWPDIVLFLTGYLHS